MLKALKNFFFPPPRFKSGDELYMSSTDFPDLGDTVLIVSVGKTEYLFQFKKYGGKNHTAEIGYFDRNYSNIKDF